MNKEPSQGREAVAAKRPRDRSDRILAAATRLLCERGYSAVSLDEIGEAVGITGPAIYRHFDGKEALMVAVTERMIAGHVERSQAAMRNAQSPQARLTALAENTCGPQIEELNFWPTALAELRHLPREVSRRIYRAAAVARNIWIDTLLELHPELMRKEAEFLTDVGGCLTGALLYYQPQLSKSKVVDLNERMLIAAYSGPLNSQADQVEQEAQGPAGLNADRARGTTSQSGGWPGPRKRGSARERILASAIPLFRTHGFSGIGIDDIGADAGITGPGVYRHYKNKEEILVTAMARVNEELAGSVGRALSAAASALEALERVVDGYIDLTVDDTDLMAVYWRQKHELSGDQKGLIMRGERSYVEDWINILLEVRSDLSEAEARTMAYGALALINGYWQSGVALPHNQTRAMLRSLVLNALLST